MIRRVEAAEHGERIAAPGAVPPGQRRHGPRRPTPRAGPAGTIRTGRDGSIGVPIEPLGRDELDARARIQSPAQPRLGQERVQHAPLASPRWIP